MSSDIEGSRDARSDILENQIVNDLEVKEDTDQAVNSDFDTAEAQQSWNNFPLASGRARCPCLLLHTYTRCIYAEGDIGERQNHNTEAR